MIRALVRLAVTYAVTRALTRAGGPGAVLASVLGKGKRKNGGSRGRRGR